MQLAFHFDGMNGLSDRFNTVKGLAGIEWVVAFCKLQDLTLRAHVHSSRSRAIGSSRARVTLLSENLKTYYERNFLLRDVFSMDETGISTVTVGVPNVTTKGKATVRKAASGEDG